jgi:glutathione S-transferase
MAIELHAYRYSVYGWIARLALHEKGLPYDWVEVDPFADPLPDGYLDKHPFRRVPVLVHDGYVVYETGAITRYIDEAFDGPSLQPATPKERARMSQIISVADNYTYWPLVRQVFSHSVFRPRQGRPAEESEVEQGLAAAPRVLGALEKLAGDGAHLAGDRLSLADIHLAPMISCFTEDARAAGMLHGYPRLSQWWASMRARPAFLDTKPVLP